MGFFKGSVKNKGKDDNSATVNAPKAGDCNLATNCGSCNGGTCQKPDDDDDILVQDDKLGRYKQNRP